MTALVRGLRVTRRAPFASGLAGWRRERMPVLPDAPSIELAPDWAREVLSLRMRIDLSLLGADVVAKAP